MWSVLCRDFLVDLELDGEAHCHRVLEDDIEARYGLLRGLALVVPDRRKGGLDVILVEILYGRPGRVSGRTWSCPVERTSARPLLRL